MTLGERVVADIRTAVFDHLTELDAGFYDTVKSGELVSRLSADTTQLKSAFGASASVALRNFVLFLGAGGMMVYTSPRLSALVALAIPLIVLPLVASGRSVRDRSRLAQDRLADASAYATEAIGAMRVMQAFVAEKLTMQRFSEAAEDAYETARIATRARSLLTGIGIALVFSSVVGILWYGAQDVLAGRLSSGTLSQFVLFAVLAASSLGELSQVWGEISAAAGAASRLAELLALVPSIRTPEHPVSLPVPSPGTIEFHNVAFAYPSRPNEKVLDGVSFTVKKGERVAIVGSSGAGKSTIMQLVLRFYDATEGDIVMDGVPLREADPRAVRSRIAYVPQDSVIFGASIAENIRFGRPDARDEDVKAAAKRAIVDDFVAQWPEAYDTRVGERGVTLSGGQRQRLAIARAILKDAPILLLDEATSALDAESETLVQSALDHLMEGRTTIVIAHRLSTIVTADRILVMEHGRIAEEGDHATLVAKGGLYARLAALQFEAGV
jgi:ATP-binding cassette subfamily B protein